MACIIAGLLKRVPANASAGCNAVRSYNEVPQATVT